MPLQWRLAFLVAFLSVLLLAAAGCVYERLAERRDFRRHPPPGRMVRVGEYRLHLLSKGEAGPAVIIEQGAGELSRFWWKLQDEISAFAQVCTYDRAGYGWSEPLSKALTIAERAEDLRTLLEKAGIAAPYLLVAHSYGGLIVRHYAEAHPSEVAGLVLVDTPEESSIFHPDVLSFYAKVRSMNRLFAVVADFGLLRLLRHFVPLDRYGFWLTRGSEYRALVDDLLSVERVAEVRRASRQADSLGTLPVIVISHGQPFPGPFAVLETNWSEGQRRLAALSTNSQLFVSERSNHMIHDDDPELVLASIRSMVQSIRAGTALQGRP